MSLYLKIVVAFARLILGIFSLTVPESARSQTPTSEARRDAIAEAPTPRKLRWSGRKAENGPRPLGRLQPAQCSAFVGGFDELEPISKSFEEDDEASELHEAKEVLRIKLPADKDAALPLNPGEEPFDQPAPGISPKSASILRRALAAIGAVRRDHLDAVFA